MQNCANSVIQAFGVSFMFSVFGGVFFFVLFLYLMWSFTDIVSTL